MIFIFCTCYLWYKLGTKLSHTMVYCRLQILSRRYKRACNLLLISFLSDIRRMNPIYRLLNFYFFLLWYGLIVLVIAWQYLSLILADRRFWWKIDFLRFNCVIKWRFYVWNFRFCRRLSWSYNLTNILQVDKSFKLLDNFTVVWKIYQSRYQLRHIGIIWSKPWR